MKYSLSPQEIPQALPSGFPLCSGYISPYIPLLDIIQMQSIPVTSFFSMSHSLESWVQPPSSSPCPWTPASDTSLRYNLYEVQGTALRCNKVREKNENKWNTVHFGTVHYSTNSVLWARALKKTGISSSLVNYFYLAHMEISLGKEALQVIALIWRRRGFDYGKPLKSPGTPQC